MVYALCVQKPGWGSEPGVLGKPLQSTPRQRPLDIQPELQCLLHVHSEQAYSQLVAQIPSLFAYTVAVLLQVI